MKVMRLISGSSKFLEHFVHCAKMSRTETPQPPKVGYAINIPLGWEYTYTHTHYNSHFFMVIFLTL